MATAHPETDPGDARPTGIEPIGELPWGSHICMFYETGEDLIEANVEYFGAGLGGNEYCVWGLSEPLTEEQARRALRLAIPEADRRLEEGAIELIPDYRSYLGRNGFDPKQIAGHWVQKLAEARARGFEGLRVSGNAFWMERHLWETFSQYEAELDEAVAGRPMLVLCTYRLSAARAVDILDVAVTHNFTIARRDGRWEYIETPELRAAKRQIRRLNNAVDILSLSFPGHEKLTGRERTMLAQIVLGASNKEAARALDISPRTAEFHRANILRKLEVRNLPELMHLVLGGMEPRAQA
ncbi:MAG TPA: MEDS domain-containing protein [Allosphingosinicella sp.]